ncbi:uncharacterized protein LOC143235300 isoform X2 [Tachypleus tridentatus]|uniref:uncharacterized protein LOC143235300 isoform X2 n=2 Tax=Tachypleus tridentatus TaxID=6853 RepID=UPI003FD16EE5
MKVEPFSEEERDVLLNMKLEKNEQETFTTMNTTGKTSYFEERSVHTNLMFDMIKEETEDICDRDVEEIEDIFIQEKAEQPGDLLEGGIISKPSDDAQDHSDYNNMNVKTKTEFQEEIKSVIESTPDMKNCCVSHCPGYYTTKQEDYIVEVINSPKPNNDICGETTSNENNQNKFNIHQRNSYVMSGKEFETMNNLTQKERIESGEKLYHYAVFWKTF